MDTAREGFFLVRLCKGGPDVAARVRRFQGCWFATIGRGDPLPRHENPLLAPRVMEFCNHGRAINEADYRDRLARHTPDPDRPMCLTEMPPLY